MAYSYTFPERSSPDPVAAPSRDQSLSLGRDLKFSAFAGTGDLEVTPDGDYLLVEGLQALRQAVFNALATSPGEYRYRPDYGVGLEDFIGRAASPGQILEVESRIKLGLLRLKRVQEVSSVEISNNGDGTFEVTITIRAAGQTVRFAPFTFRQSAG